MEQFCSDDELRTLDDITRYVRSAAHAPCCERIASSQCPTGTRLMLARPCRWTREILEGLNFLHQNSIIHLDIKPNNIFLDLREPQHVKVGAATVLRHLASRARG